MYHDLSRSQCFLDRVRWEINSVGRLEGKMKDLVIVGD